MKEEVVVFRANEFLRTQARLRFPKDFPDGRVVKNLPCKAGDVGSNPDYGTKIPHGEEQLTHMQQLESPWATTRNARDAVKTSPTMTKVQGNQIIN